MDQSEIWAKDYLVHRGFEAAEIVYEPDGNVPPDFLVEGRIAVEVRRLNQQLRSATGEPEAVEGLSLPLRNHLEQFLESLGPPLGGVSWWVFYEFARPQLTKSWKPILRSQLQPFLDGHVRDMERTISIDSNFKLQLVQQARPGSHAFVLGGEDDLDTGGWVGHEFQESLRRCIEDKSDKVANYRAKYPEWWLVLVDHMLGGAPRQVHCEHDWDRVLIIHPSNWAWAYEVRSTTAKASGSC